MTTKSALEHLGHRLGTPSPEDLARFPRERWHWSVLNQCQNCGWIYQIGRPSGVATAVGEELSAEEIDKRNGVLCPGLSGQH
jgi:hypothetical protein